MSNFRDGAEGRGAFSEMERRSIFRDGSKECASDEDEVLEDELNDFGEDEESDGDIGDSDEELDAEETAALIEEIAKDPPKAEQSWKKNLKSIDELLKRRHGSVVKLSWHPTKGRVLLSRKPFSTGQMILTDRPLIMVPSPEGDGNDLWDTLVTVCRNRKFPLDPLWYWAALTAACPAEPPGCSRSSPSSPRRPPSQLRMGESRSVSSSPRRAPSSPSQRNAAEPSAGAFVFPSEDEEAGEDLEGAQDQATWTWLSPPSAAVAKRLSLLYIPDVSEASLEVLILLHELKLTETLEPLVVEERLQTAIQNSFQCSDTYERSNLGIYFTPSFVSHSCIPNAAGVVDSAGMFSLVAQRNIRAGEEICISYIGEDDLRLSTAHRRSVLAKSRRFVCLCARCDGNDAIRPASCLICGQILLYMQTGEEMKKQSFCRRLAAQSLINTYVWSHQFFCAMSGGN